MTAPSTEAAAARDYGRAAEDAAGAVIARYSTSFGIATRLLGGPVRPRTRSVYALVRVADEIVDGAAAGSGVDRERVQEILDAYEAGTEQAMREGFSTDLVLHAFADVARRCGITTELTRPFFASMRMDLTRTDHTPESFAQYVHGSAEVVGLMCLQVFLTDRAERPTVAPAHLVDGASRLGAGFQKVNFLRDLRADADGRGRHYFPGLDPAHLTDTQKDALIDDIDADLAAGRAVIDELPRSSRRAVRAAHDLFAELSARLRDTEASTLRTTRIRVPDSRKAVLLARSVVGAPRSGVSR
ncbi:MAG: squalene/phytoene synthase family protein [Brachybacterium sp.]|nr:squalene/phytoene synthase family protein [Brachybacterium sp.]